MDAWLDDTWYTVVKAAGTHAITREDTHVPRHTVYVSLSCVLARSLPYYSRYPPLVVVPPSVLLSTLL